MRLSQRAQQKMRCLIVLISEGFGRVLNLLLPTLLSSFLVESKLQEQDCNGGLENV